MRLDHEQPALRINRQPDGRHDLRFLGNEPEQQPLVQHLGQIGGQPLEGEEENNHE